MTGKTKARLGAALVAVVVAAGSAWALLSPGAVTRSAPPAAGADSGLPPEARTPEARRGEVARSAWLAIPAPVVPFLSLAGDTVSLRDYRGKIVVLNFWGTWCPPCRREIPELVDLQRRLAASGELDATIVSIAVDSGTPADIRAFADTFSMNYPIWSSGSDRVVHFYQVMGFPTTFLIDGDGVIRRRYLGPQRADRLLADVRRLSGGSPG